MFLPPEIIAHIVAFTDDKATLLNLTYCLHHFYYLFTPHLYKDIHLKARYSDGESQYRTVWRYVHLRSLACLLLERSDLACHVRRFTLGDRGRLCNSPESGSKIRNIGVEDDLKSVIKASSPSIDEEELWLTHVGWHGTLDSILALLFPALVNLTDLDLIAEYSDKREQKQCLNSIDPASSSLIHLKLWNYSSSMANVAKLICVPRALSTLIYQATALNYSGFGFTAIRDALRP